MRFEETGWLFGIWASPLLVLIASLAVRAGRRAMSRFADRSLVARVDGARSLGRPVARVTLIALAIALSAVALARPQWGTKEGRIEKSGRDVVFLLDVSRSMLAEDLAPNRLERAKLWIGDTLNVVRGDRVALVAFAGTSAVKCPLTLDYGFFKFALDDITTDAVARGGTNIGDALRRVRTEVFGLSDEGEEEERFRDVILITDGEDHESFPVQAAEQLGAEGVRVICIGLGDEEAGVRIPLPTGGYVTHEGEVVKTRLDAEMLRELANATPGGTYLNVATGTIELDRVYERLIRSAEQSAMEAREVVRHTERFQIFLLGAVLCVLAERTIATSGRRRKEVSM